MTMSSRRRSAPGLLLVICAMGLGAITRAQEPFGPVVPVWGPNGPVMALALDGDTLYVGGAFDQVGPATGTFALVQTANDRAFTTGANSRTTPGLNAMVSDGAGGWFVSGAEFRSLIDFTPVIDHLRPDGSVDRAWTRPAIDSTGTAILADGGRVLIAGRFVTVNGVVRPGLAALDATTGALLPWNAGVSFAGQAGIVFNAVAAAGRLYVTGAFDRIGGQPRDRFAVLDAATGAALAPVLLSGTSSLDVSIAVSGNRVYLLGNCRPGPYVLCAYDLDLSPQPGWTFPEVEYPFVASSAAVFATRRTIGRVMTTRTVKLDTVTGAEMAWAAPTTGGGPAWAMALTDTRLYLGGEFSSVNGAPRSRLAAVDVATGALASWAPLVGGSVTAIGVSGDTVAFGGTFRSVGGLAKNNLVAIDLRTGRPSSRAVPDLPLIVSAFTRLGEVMVVGGLRPFGGPAAPDVVAFSVTTGALVPWSLGTNGSVGTLASDGRRLYVGGSFSSVSGTPRLNMAAVDLQTGTLTSWNPAPNGYVQRLAVSDGAVYASGGFSTIRGFARGGIAAWDTESGAVLSFNPGTALGASTSAIAFFRDRVLLVGQRAPQTRPFDMFDWVDRVSGSPTLPASDANLRGWDATRAGDAIYAIGSRSAETTLTLATVDGPTGTVRLRDVVTSVATDPQARLAASDDYVVVGGSLLSADAVPVHNLAVFRGPKTIAPRQLTASVVDAGVTLGWKPGTPPAASFVVEAGTSSGAADVGTFSVGTATSVSGGLPAGTYYLRVRAAYPGNNLGSASSEVIARVPPTSTPPNAPGALTSSVTSGLVTLSWGAANGNATTYVVEAGTASGLTNIGTIATGHLDTAFSTAAPAGTYFVRVRAANAFGLGPPSNEVVVVVP